MICEFIAPGFEEIEAITPLDLLRRGGVEVFTVGIGGKTVEGAHNIKVDCDFEESEAEFSGSLDGIILPGGMPGTENLKNSAVVRKFIDFAYKNNLMIAAICAAPSILGEIGILEGKKAVCYPSYEKFLRGAAIGGADTVKDGNIITSKSAGTAVSFSLEIIKYLKGSEKADEIRRAVYWKQ
ncbi:MAG: DJ-1/PfpI family protein [Oscillospiraceae bacterium]|nr:DJ-1/PfpI family protein [Oscillospiraceae bacterium]